MNNIMNNVSSLSSYESVLPQLIDKAAAGFPDAATAVKECCTAILEDCPLHAELLSPRMIEFGW
jgi:hypothetical protein